jgi:hypothetical protein
MIEFLPLANQVAALLKRHPKPSILQSRDR